MAKIFLLRMNKNTSHLITSITLGLVLLLQEGQQLMDSVTSCDHICTRAFCYYCMIVCIMVFDQALAKLGYAQAGRGQDSRSHQTP